jgi:hypothetical protein
MPLQIRLFFWLSVAVVAYWAIRASSFWIQSTPYLAGLNRYFVRTAMDTTLFVTIPWCALTFGIAWLAAFRHYNWARWAFVILFLFREIVLFADVARSVQVRPYGYNYLRYHWAAPSQFLTTSLLLAASTLVFAGNAKGWFKTRAESRVFSN